jgi:undecaprenyl-diphosphatase
MLPFRERPFENPDLNVVLSFVPDMRTWSSFPSDHAVMAFAIAASLFRLVPIIGLWAFFHAAVFISLPRLFLGLHYPSDVLAGALIGITLGVGIPRLPRLDAVTGALIDIEGKFPAPFYAIGFLTLFEIAEMFDSVRLLMVGVFRVIRQMLS